MELASVIFRQVRMRGMVASPGVSDSDFVVPITWYWEEGDEQLGVILEATAPPGMDPPPGCSPNIPWAMINPSEIDRLTTTVQNSNGIVFTEATCHYEDGQIYIDILGHYGIYA